MGPTSEESASLSSVGFSNPFCSVVKGKRRHVEKEKQNLGSQAIHECCLHLGKNSGFDSVFLGLLALTPPIKYPVIVSLIDMDHLLNILIGLVTDTKSL